MKLIIAIALLFFATSANAADWYFDKDSIGGTCSDTGAGSISQPFCNPYNKLWTLEWNGAAAGDTIWFRGGTYTTTYVLGIKGHHGVLSNGTEANPITIRSYPGENVIFDGQGTRSYAMIFYGTVHDLHIIGPIKITGYTSNALAMDNSSAAGINSNILFDNITIEDSGSGLYFRWVDGVTVKNSTFRRLNGYTDNVIGVGIRGNGAGGKSDNVLIENCDAYDINDGRGNDNGDADGFWTNSEVVNVTLKDLNAYRCSEDGIDTKAAVVTMENLVAHSNGATGIKMWGSDLATDTTQRVYTATRLLAYNNSETGVKCTGRRGGVTATIDHLTSWGNGQDNLKNVVTESEVLNTCDLTVRNSILGNTAGYGTTIEAPPTGGVAETIFDHVNIYGSGVMAITAAGCSAASGKWTDSQYSTGTYNTDASANLACGSGYGTISGLSTSTSISDPQLTSEPPTFEWASIAENAITSNSVLLVTEASYPWPSPTVGHYIEINDDGVLREITSIGDSTTRTINFSPSVSSEVCGLATTCRGIRVTGWQSGSRAGWDLTPEIDSFATNAGLYVSGVHCSSAGDTGDCVTWYGSAPDLGYSEWGTRGAASLNGGGNAVLTGSGGLTIQ